MKAKYSVMQTAVVFANLRKVKAPNSGVRIPINNETRLEWYGLGSGNNPDINSEMEGSAGANPVARERVRPTWRLESPETSPAAESNNH